MRNEPLHAYSLHQRPYQEKRSLYYLFTKEHGILHGVGRKGIPQFAPLMLFATGKKSLKTLQQVNIVEAVPSLVGQQQYAALYLNEITLRLLPIEDSMPAVYKQYALTISQLQQSLSIDELKLVLRHYEQVLFAELGFAVDLEQDSEQALIDVNQCYYFVPDQGWVKCTTPNEPGQDNKATAVDFTLGNSNKAPKDPASSSRYGPRNPSTFMQQSPIMGKTIVAMQSGINEETINSWTRIHRQLIDHLFDYQPLQSRILWQQFYRYQS